MLYFWNPDDLFIPNMMIDTSPWSSCSRHSPWLPCSGHTSSYISSIEPSVSPFRDFLDILAKETEQELEKKRYLKKAKLKFKNFFLEGYRSNNVVIQSERLGTVPWLTHLIDHLCRKLHVQKVFSHLLRARLESKYVIDQQSTHGTLRQFLLKK